MVDVQDVNDNPPVFEHESYSANVLESEAVNTKVIFYKNIIDKQNITNILSSNKILHKLNNMFKNVDCSY